MSQLALLSLLALGNGFQDVEYLQHFLDAAQGGGKS